MLRGGLSTMLSSKERKAIDRKALIETSVFGINSILTIVGSISSIVALYFLIKGTHEDIIPTLWAIGLVLILSLGISAHWYKAKKEKFQKLFYGNASIMATFHHLNHQIRDWFAPGKIEERRLHNQGQIDAEYRLILTNILNKLSDIFGKLTASECHSNIMIIEENGVAKTVLYCSKVSENRKRERDQQILVTQGILGKCGLNKSPEFYQDNEKPQLEENSSYFQIRDNDSNFYRAGISCPITVNGEILGFVNVDSRSPNIWLNYHKEVLAIFTDLIALLAIQNINELQYEAEEEV